MFAAASTCHACGKSGTLLLCGRCRNVWFCNRECQSVARKELGHRGASCRAAERALSTPVDDAKLVRNYADLMDEANDAHMQNTRIGDLAAVENFKKAASVAELIGGANGALWRTDAEQLLSDCLSRSGDMAASARAASASLRSARASGNMSVLVTALSICGDAAKRAPSEMANAERESREQERRCGSPSYGGVDLSQEGRISLPITPTALSRLGLAYFEAAVAICDAARGRGSPAAVDDPRVPNLRAEVQARCFLADCLDDMGEERQRSLELLWQAVALRRQVLRTAAPGLLVHSQRMLADQLSTLGFLLKDGGSREMAEAEACRREALALVEGLEDVFLSGKILRYLINLSGEAHATVGPAEAEVFRSRLNQVLLQMGREIETSCSICLEPLVPPSDSATEDAAGGGGSGSATGPSDSCVRVYQCSHQFHHGCISSWRCTASKSKYVCPVCKE